MAAVVLTSAQQGGACEIIESHEPEFNYDLKFSLMPEPRAEVVHSRVEREVHCRLFWLFPLPPRNAEWEFELVAAPSWVDALKTDFAPDDWDSLEPRDGIPGWFSPSPDAFSLWYMPGASETHSAHLFIEKAPDDPERVRIFIRRH